MRTKLRKNVFGFEHKGEPLLSKRLFVSRSINHLILGICTIIISLMIGVIGYHFLEELNWIDSLLNASMILGGMGPVDVLKTDNGKFFASMYALFSGIVFLVTVGIIFAPVVHRFLHSLHVSNKNDDD
jgi:hypothetical protein